MTARPRRDTTTTRHDHGDAAPATRRRPALVGLAAVLVVLAASTAPRAASAAAATPRAASTAATPAGAVPESAPGILVPTVAAVGEGTEPGRGAASAIPGPAEALPGSAPTAADGPGETVATGGGPAATFQVNWKPSALTPFGTPCADWDPAAQSAFGRALFAWAAVLTAPPAVPIKIEACWSDFGPGAGQVLGYSGPAMMYKNFDGAPYADTWFPDAIANAVTGTDVNPGAPEIRAAFNSTASVPPVCGAGSCWNTEVGAPGPSRYDLQSVAMHELGHGLGFLGSFRIDAQGMGNVCADQTNPNTCVPTPLVFDRFTQRGNGTALLSQPLPGPQLAADLTSGDLYWNGSWARRANNGQRPRLYAPAAYSAGSSYSHLDESTYPASSPGALMTPVLANGETQRVADALTAGMMRDMGWPMRVPSEPIGVTATAGERSVALSWSPPTELSGYPLLGYSVTITETGATIDVGTATAATLDHMTPGLGVTFTVSARNAVGTGPPSVPTATVFPTGAETGTGFHAVPPFRVLDSRNGTGFAGPVGTDLSRNLAVAGVGAVPASATAVVMNVTVTGGTQPSYLTVYPAGAPPPTPGVNASANLLFGPGQTVPNLVTTGVGAGGLVSVYNQRGTVHVVADVVGYYDDGASPADGFVGAAPARLLDSRGPVGGWPGSLGQGASRNLAVAGVAGVPPDASAVVMNVTVTGATAASYLQVYPAGTTPGVTANLLFGSGQTVPNLVVVGLGTGGAVTFFNQLGAVHVVADVMGYYGPGGDRFHAVAPVRLLDSRDGTGVPTGPWSAAQTRSFVVAGALGIPGAATAVVLNTTATGGTVASFLTAFPDGDPNPGTANLLWGPGQTVPNAVIVKLGDNPVSLGRVALFNQLGSVHVVADASGYFAPT